MDGGSRRMTMKLSKLHEIPPQTSLSNKTKPPTIPERVALRGESACQNGSSHEQSDRSQKHLQRLDCLALFTHEVSTTLLHSELRMQHAPTGLALLRLLEVL